MSIKKLKKKDTWNAGQLVEIFEGHNSDIVTGVELLELHPFFEQPRQIWDPIAIFWNNQNNLKEWGTKRSASGVGRVPDFPREWITPFKVELFYDFSELGVHQRDIAKTRWFADGEVLMVVEVIVTPWKKRYRKAGGITRKQRFSYVKFLAMTDEKPRYVYYDMSEQWEKQEIVSPFRICE